MLIVKHLGTKVISINDKANFKTESETKHERYFSIVLDTSGNNNTALFNVDFLSQFEMRELIGYSLRTITQFILENFDTIDDKYVVLEDYFQLAYRNHINDLKQNLKNSDYVSVIKNEPPILYRNFSILNELERALNFASIEAN